MTHSCTWCCIVHLSARMFPGTQCFTTDCHAYARVCVVCVHMCLQAGSSSSNTGLVVDVPQPLSSRHAGLLRSPGRSLPAPSDPGSATATGSAFSYAANMAAAQVSSASAGGAAGFEQQRRMGAAASTHTGIGSLGGSQAASRRISRNASSRLNADQDWALLGPDGQSLQQQLAAMQTPQQRTSLGQVLHAPGAASRRASRTLSGAGCSSRALQWHMMCAVQTCLASCALACPSLPQVSLGKGGTQAAAEQWCCCGHLQPVRLCWVETLFC